MPRGEDVPRTTWLALAALTALGAALRLYGLDTQSLWNDELGGFKDATDPSLEAIFLYGPSPDHLPAYFLLLRVWVAAMGDSETLLRLPSALCGIATIPAMFALGRRWFGPREGLIAAAVTAVAWAPVYHSQEARPYALLLLGVVLSTVWVTDVVRGLRARGSAPRAALVGAAVAAIVTSQAHFFGTLFIALQAATAAVATWRSRGLRTVVALYGVVALAFLPAAYRFLQVTPEAAPWMPLPTAKAPWALLLFLFNDSVPLLVAVLALWSALLVRTARTPAGATTTWLAIVWLCAPVAFAFAYSHWRQPIFLSRALLIVLPAAYLLVARALTQLRAPRPLAVALAAGLCGVLLVDLVAARDYYTRPTKTQFREAAGYLVAHDRPAEPAWVLACAFSPRYFDYYLRRLGSPRRVEVAIRNPAEAAEQAQRVAAQRPERVWLLAGHLACDPGLIAALTAEMELVDHRALHNAGVWQFRRREAR